MASLSDYFGRSLAMRLLASIVLLAAVILTGVGITSYFTARNALVEQAQLQAKTLAERSALAVNGEFEPISRIPLAIAAGEQRPLDGATRKAQLNETLPALLAQFPTAKNTYVFFEKQVIKGQDYAEVWYTREQNTVKATYSNIPSSPGYDSSKELYDYFKETWYTQARNASSTVWSEPYLDIASNMTLVSGTAPIIRDGRLLGVAGMDFDLNSVNQMVQQIRPTERSHAFLVSSSGRFIGNPTWPESVLKQTISELGVSLNSPGFEQLGKVMLTGESDVIELIDPKTGEVAWAAYQQIPSTGWSIALIVPQKDLLQSVDQLRLRALLVGVAGLVILAVLLYLIARSLTKPIQQLTVAAQAMAQGDLNNRVRFSRSDEIGVLAVSFNTMANALQERIVAEQGAQAEARQLQEAEAESRQQLEQTVAHYLLFAERVAKGDLTQRLQVQSTGALGQLGAGLNSMVANLHGITSQVQQANTAIAAAAAEILAATTQQASSAAEQSAALTQTSTTIEEVKVIAQQTALQASQVAQDSQAMLQVARHGTQAVEETVSGMSQIKDRVGSIAETILALAEQTQAISTIITSVSELADQSNLLALNAAIEAARAGEQGKSFAVVAQHVRELAERSKVATGQVREILGEIQRATNAAVLVTEEGTKGVEAGGKLATQAGQVIHRIAGEVEGGAQANVQIAAAAQQQTAGMEQIGQAMGSIQQATGQALASTRQAERAAQDLHTLAQSLQQAIATYRL